MKTYQARVVWTLIANVSVEARSKAEARKKLEDAPLPEVVEYLEDSFEIDTIEEEG